MRKLADKRINGGDMKVPCILPAVMTLTPDQFLPRARMDSEIIGEKALMLAVLEDAIRCYQRPPVYRYGRAISKSRLVAEALEWIMAEDIDWPFSFNNLCENLGIDASAFRRALLNKGAINLEAPKTYRLRIRSHNVIAKT